MDHRALLARTALPEKDPALQDHLVATQSFTNASSQFLLNARARRPLVRPVLLARQAQTVPPETQAATDATARTVHQARPVHQALQALQATPETRVHPANPALSPPVPSHHRVQQASPADQALPVLLERVALPAKTETTVLQVPLVNLASAVHPVETASPARRERQDSQVPQAAATTAHQLVSLRDISLPSLFPTIPTSIHLGWSLLLVSTYTTTTTATQGLC